MFQLICFGKGSWNFQGGLYKVGLPSLPAAAAPRKAKGMSWGRGVAGQTDEGLTFRSLKCLIF